MAVVKLVAGPLTSLTVTGLSTLASATYVASNVKDNTTNQPLDVMVEVTVATTNTPAGNKQVVVFAQASYDNTNFQTGPTSGTTTTEEPVLTLLGVVPLPLASTTERKSFAVAAAYAGAYAVAAVLAIWSVRRCIDLRVVFDTPTIRALASMSLAAVACGLSSALVGNFSNSAFATCAAVLLGTGAYIALLWLTKCSEISALVTHLGQRRPSA